MTKTAKLVFDDRSIELPIIEGTEGERAVDISQLRKETGLITLDTGYVNTGSCTSEITFIDGERGILRHRGYDIAELSQQSTFMEVAHLLVYGHLPKSERFAEFRQKIFVHSIIHEDMKNFFNNYPGQSHPMAILSAMVCSLAVYHPRLLEPELTEDEKEETITHLLSKVRVLAAFAYKRSIGDAFVYPRQDLDYIGNFLHMMFTNPVKQYPIDETARKALDMLFILHADHEQNCSTSTVRMVGSSKANLFASISAGICALWGPLHGGANQSVIEMLQRIVNDGGNYKKYLEKAKDKNDPFRLMGFGHRVYKNYDPRARIIKNHCDQVLSKFGQNDKMLEIAKRLEEAALTDSYFVERKLFPNVDFYSGIIYRALGIPSNMFTVMFALGRLPGWIAQWKEMVEGPALLINRPRQIYTGSTQRPFVPIAKR